MRISMAVLAVLSLVFLAMSHLGVLHPLGDSLAVVRGVMVMCSIVAVLILWVQRRWMLTAAAFALVSWSAYTVFTPRLMLSPTQDMPYALYQKNMLFKMPSTKPLEQEIRALSPDFITLQEVSGRNQLMLAGLADVYPSQVYCPFGFVGGDAVASRWPMIAGTGRCPKAGGMAAMQVETPEGPVWVVSLHLHWPFPYEQAAQVQALLPTLTDLKGPVVLGGDFNMVPWSYVMHQITAATRTQRIGAPKHTFALWIPNVGQIGTLPIDHVLVNSNSRPADTHMRPLLGSDHFGLLARFYIN